MESMQDESCSVNNDCDSEYEPFLKNDIRQRNYGGTTVSNVIQIYDCRKGNKWDDFKCFPNIVFPYCQIGWKSYKLFLTDAFVISIYLHLI